MSNIASNRFGAAGSALGYLAQIDYALLIALERMDSEESLRISLETIDDFTFEPDGKPQELWQTKHHIGRQGSLGDASPDLWKTLHNWIEMSGNDSACFLYTTATAKSGTAAALLGPTRSSKDVLAAREKLDGVAQNAGNVASSDYYRKYLSLDALERTALLNRVIVLGEAATAEQITHRLVAAVRKTTVKRWRRPLVDRLLGWWHGHTMLHLSKVARGEHAWIELSEIEDQLHMIAQSLRNEKLPLDYDYEPEPSIDEVKEDDRVFVEQLRIILLHNERIRQAVYDHNRAFLQRSQWQREGLLNINELESYDRRLLEEWKRVFLPLEEPGERDSVSDDDKRACARDTFQKIQLRALPEIRSEVQSGYVSLGSLHILADKLRIGWHPDWVDLLKHRLAEVQEVDPAEVA